MLGRARAGAEKTHAGRPTTEARVGAAAPHGALRSGLMRILLIEDFGELARGVTWALARSGHVVTAAATAAEAEAAYRCDAFDLVLMDLKLPDGDGWTLMQALTARRPVQGIAMSGMACPADVERSRQAGFAMHLPKPMDYDVLLSVVASIERDQTAMAARSA